MNLSRDDYDRAVRAMCAPPRRPLLEWWRNWGEALTVALAWGALVVALANADAAFGWLLGGAR